MLFFFVVMMLLDVLFSLHHQAFCSGNDIIQPPIHLHVTQTQKSYAGNLHNQHNANLDVRCTNETSQALSAERTGSTFYDSMVVIMHLLKEYTQAVTTRTQVTSQSILQWIASHKLITASTLAAGLYCTIGLLILSDQHYLRNPHRWSNWLAPLSYEQIYEIPPYTLQHDLIVAIQCRYADKNNPSNFLLPLMKFMNDITREQERVDRYLFYSRLLKKTPFLRILPLQQDLIDQAENMSRFVCFLYNNFLTWLATYNMTQAQVPFTR
jgi:hypothetical protein